MEVSWPEFKIDQLKSQVKGSIAMGPFGSRIKAENFVTSGVPVIKGAQLHGAYVSDINFDYLTEEKARELSSSIAVRRDLVITHRGTIGQVCIIPDDSEYEKYIVSQSQLKVTLDQTKINPYFANYFFRSRLGQHRLLANASQVGVPAIAKASTSVKEILVPCPELSVQQRVVDILRSLDDKIELNRQMNETLEAMAQALFKSWFVDFDPVIDNALAAGNEIPEPLQKRAAARQALGDQSKPLPAEIQSLFPDSFVFTDEMGWVPEGWEPAMLGQFVTVKRGGSPRPIHDYLVEEGLPWVKISDATASSSRFIMGTKQFIKSEGLKKTVKLDKGELILSNSATPGLPKFLNLEACIHDGWLFFPKKELFGDNYLYQLFLVIREQLVSQGNGSVFTNLKTDILKNHRVVIPAIELMGKAESRLGFFHQRCLLLQEENNTLISIRDNLLPKLLSGELRLPDVEKQVAEAV